MMNATDKLLTALGFDTELSEDMWTKKHIYHGIGNHCFKKWVANILPSELLKRSIKDAVNSIVTLCECHTFYNKFPNPVYSPDYGDTWGRSANYIEINNRAIAEMYGDQCKNGILSSIKLLPAIPPSAKSWANCVILSQIFPNIFGDGYNKGPFEENSIYGIKLGGKYSKNIICKDIEDKISPEEQFKAFNNLAHFRGIKTGFRVAISEGQMKVATGEDTDIPFNWDNYEHQELFINECVKLMKLGFEAMFIDSAKHIGGFECEHYTGVGRLPNYEQMQYILNEIRARSGSFTLSFVGEKSTGDFERYKNLGLTSGTAFVDPNDFNSVKHWSEQLKYNREYAPGVEVSNDNDPGGATYEERLNRIRTSLFANEFPSDKLPSFMQMHDIFPLRYDTNTHHLMMTNPSYSTDGTPNSHFENLFTKDDGRQYNHAVGEIFAHALCH
ncbi:MAG: hypothetical protein OSJ27_04945 [Candidatus Gastranaerophilales bacterium]|nr:hypothetical protein [Candidatus Gastranaerophilales bacterium]